jgi:hypothetical protein
VVGLAVLDIYEAMGIKITVPTEGKPRISGSLDQSIIRLSREVEDWTTDVSKYRISSNRTDKVMSVVVGEEVNR